MKKLIIGIMLTLSSSLWASSSFEHAQMVYSKILQSNNLWFVPDLSLDASTDANASCGFFKISINYGMLRFAKNDAELAMVLGHELAHFTLGHHGSNPAAEYAADQLGAYYMSKAGYNVCKGAKLIKRFHEPLSRTHPDSDSRYKAICH